MAALSVVSTPPRAASASKEIAPRPAQQLPRASQVVPSQVAAFSKGAQLAPAPPVTRFSTPASEASAMGTPARASGVFPLMSTSSNLSEVMHPFPTSMSLTPGLFSQALQPFPTSMSATWTFGIDELDTGPAISGNDTFAIIHELDTCIGHSSQVPSAALPLLNPASATPPPTGYLPKVPSSPSEPDPMMWSEGVRSLGDYMAAKAMGNLPEEMRRIPTPMTMFSAPTTFFDVSTEKDGLQLKPLPPLNEEDPSKEINFGTSEWDMPEYPTEPEKLTIGLVEPEAVERCRDRYTEELDGQLLEATRAIERANAEKKTRLRQEFFQMREQYNNEVENELLEQARIVVEKYHDRLAVLQEEADRQRRRLDREADTLLQESQRYYHFKAEARRLFARWSEDRHLPMSRFSGLVSRGVQAASPAVRSPAALSMGWSPPETPRPTGPTGPRPMVSRSPLGDLQTQPGLTAQAAPKLLPPRGVSGQFPDLLYPQGEIMGLGAHPRTASEIVTSVV
eukprot:g29046.t1